MTTLFVQDDTITSNSMESRTATGRGVSIDEETLEKLARYVLVGQLYFLPFGRAVGLGGSAKRGLPKN